MGLKDVADQWHAWANKMLGESQSGYLFDLRVGLSRLAF